jgi:hypothetical protein
MGHPEMPINRNNRKTLFPISAFAPAKEKNRPAQNGGGKASAIPDMHEKASTIRFDRLCPTSKFASKGSATIQRQGEADD